MTKVSEEQRELARYIASAFLVDKPPIFHFWDDNHVSDIYVLEAKDSPQKGVTSYATIGTSGYPLMRNGNEFEARVELVGACGSAFPNFGNVLATAAFCIINSKWFCAPGMVFPGIMDMYKLSVTMSDLYFTHPFLWEERLESKQIGDRQVAWLLAMPISKQESEFAQRNGPDKLEAIFIEEDVDIFNLNRVSVV